MVFTVYKYSLDTIVLSIHCYWYMCVCVCMYVCMEDVLLLVHVCVCNCLNTLEIIIIDLKYDMIFNTISEYCEVQL